MTKRAQLMASLLGLVLPSLASAGIVSIIAGATVVEDFQFNDPAGTAYAVAANSAGTGNLWSADDDLAGVATNGAGALNASAKANDAFGATLVDTLDQGSGRFLAMMSLTWNFTSRLDPNENEEIRIGFISAGLSTVTADLQIGRSDANQLEISGNAVGTGSSDLAALVLNGGSLEQIAKFIAVLLVDLDAHSYEAHFSVDDGANYLLLGTGSLDPTRGIDKLRLVLNNNLSGDNVHIDRITMARVNNATTVPEPPTAMLVLGILAIALRRRSAARA